MGIFDNSHKKIKETQYVCPFCKRIGEIVTIANTPYLKCEYCNSHLKLFDIVCPICYQQKETIKFDDSETGELYMQCWNCITLNDFRLCLHTFCGNKGCRKCGGLGLLIDTFINQNNHYFDVYRPYNDCLGAFLAPDLYDFIENGEKIGEERILEIFKKTFKTKKWPRGLEIKINYLVKEEGAR